MSAPSPQRRRELLDALRRGTVPARGLGDLAVGLERLARPLDEELAAAQTGRAGFKAIRGEYGGGKTFLARWLAERAQARGFATSEVQVSETETPVHRLEAVYRRMVERLATTDQPTAALGTVLDRWSFALEEEVLSEGGVSEADVAGLTAAVADRMEQRLRAVSQASAPFAAVLRAHRLALAGGDRPLADGLLAWVSGEPGVATSVKRAAGVKGELDHLGALAALRALLVVLRDAGHAGLLVILDEVETLQRVRSDVRERGLNVLRQLVDEVDAGHLTGLYLVITGTPAFFDGPQGIQRLPPLAQRLTVDFSADPQWDNPRAPQIRLLPFDFDRLLEVGRKVRDIHADGGADPARVRQAMDDVLLADLARSVAGKLGGQVGIAPRLYLRKLVDLLDKVELHPAFDPRQDGGPLISTEALNPEEREALAPDDVALDDL